MLCSQKTKWSWRYNNNNNKKTVPILHCHSEEEVNFRGKWYKYLSSGIGFFAVVKI